MPENQPNSSMSGAPVTVASSKAAVQAAEDHLDSVDLDAAAAAVAKLTKTLPGL